MDWTVIEVTRVLDEIGVGECLVVGTGNCMRHLDREKINQPFCGVVHNLWNGNWVVYLVQGHATTNVARSDHCAGV
jgi:hypothetical protein